MAELSVDEKNILKQAEQMELLIRSPGWPILRQLIEAQRAGHLTALANPQSGRDEDQTRKGAIFALGVLLGTPDQILDHRKEILAKLHGKTNPVASTEDGKPVEGKVTAQSPDDTVGTYQDEEATHGRS